MQGLALSPTPFIGRSEEVDEISLLLDDPSCRLLTLVGPGGIGKTRLATEIALRKEAAFSDGIYFVSLTPISQAEDLLTTIAEAMPFHFQQDHRTPREQFFDYLNEKNAKSVLLILDNFEHLLAGVELISDVLTATTNFKILVTSRETLNLQEEWVRQIGGMAYPQHHNGKPLEDYSAVQLFLDRARRIRGDFDLSADMADVVRICQLVEGMPLAIELAAGWLKTLQPADIAQEIQRNQDILATRSRNLPERHRSIRSVFTHSWELLSEKEREVFQKLSIFRGGFTREAAKVVAGASLNILAGLVDKSLVRLNAAGRYDVHELLRQYGVEQMHVANQATAIQQLYIDYYLHMLRDLETRIKGHGQLEALDTIQADFENLRNAWLWAAQQKQYAALGAAVESLNFFADMRGRYHEIVTLLRAALDQFPSTPDMATKAIQCRLQSRLIRLVLLGNMRIDFDIRSEIDTCVQVARQQEDPAEIAFCLFISAITAVWEENAHGVYTSAQAEDFFQESYAIFQELDDTFYRADLLSWLGSVTTDKGEIIPWDELLNPSLALRKEIGDRNGIAWITLNLADMMLGKGNYVACERYAQESLALMHEIGSLKGILQSMFKLAQTAMLKGDLQKARTLAEDMRDLADETNSLGGTVLSVGLLAFLICVMEEDYAEAAALAQKNSIISQESFFGGHDDMGAYWGQPTADCGMGHYEAARSGYEALFSERYDDLGPATLCLIIESAACAHAMDWQTAAEWLGLALRQPRWANGWAYHWPLVTRLRDELVHELGEEAYQAASERDVLDLETVIKSILDEANISKPHAKARYALLEPLSDRELEVLQLVAEGLSNREIAERLVLSTGTVKVHTRNIYGKLSVNNRTQAVMRATEMNLL
ncbi:AAA family ATPase [Phototrophicus methaneseepsis]|uniref:AAA family ATPase n=1 Tax=Phototrophicus methaneseepsis TaxID=2710758 RepID=A0A7S8EAG7_9CHLR|nr:LuxR C-terminal-related transcriptional regulator [Phototrophicus methaneseepsis]QPC83342.1 AAA family ATPase [Phototrophicus methaneseepsis]